MPQRHRQHTGKEGFTLIELSIVLVIIGLLVGGILVGKDLIRAAEIRSLITQIEQYKAAVNTFKLKFNAIPGDMISSNAAAFGFQSRNGGNGDGKIRATCGVTCSDFAVDVETECFWSDLATAQLIKNAVNNTCGGPPASVVFGLSNMSAYAPLTKALNGIIFIGEFTSHANLYNGDYVMNENYFYIGSLGSIDDLAGDMTSTKGTPNQFSNIAKTSTTAALLSPQDLFSVDTKFDDGKARGGIIRYGSGNFLPGSVESYPGAPDSGFCTDVTDPSGQKYNTAYTDFLCNIMIDAQF
jgi:prepilin-type N-terminal cleavage/methylation domain-containing protein